MSVQTRLRALVEKALPWYSPFVERLRNERTEAIRQRSIDSRVRAEQVIAEYRDAAQTANRAGERVIDEARRDDK